MKHLEIAAVYRPMSAVAGDFYQFIQVDEHRLGVLIADVSGHGVPAALISMMLKVAMRSVASVASDPAAVLTGLNRILSSELHGQFASAAYLWIDTESDTALYAAAGHPPLLSWCAAKESLASRAAERCSVNTNKKIAEPPRSALPGGLLRSVESNGLLLAIRQEAVYVTCRLPFCAGQRFVLYTDGILEPENAAGEAFGDRKLESVIRKNASLPPSVLSAELLAELDAWQPLLTSQQDDITVVVVDVV